MLRQLAGLTQQSPTVGGMQSHVAANHVQPVEHVAEEPVNRAQPNHRTRHLLLHYHSTRSTRRAATIGLAKNCAQWFGGMAWVTVAGRAGRASRGVARAAGVGKCRSRHVRCVCGRAASSVCRGPAWRRGRRARRVAHNIGVLTRFFCRPFAFLLLPLSFEIKTRISIEGAGARVIVRL